MTEHLPGDDVDVVLPRRRGHVREPVAGEGVAAEGVLQFITQYQDAISVGRQMAKKCCKVEKSKICQVSSPNKRCDLQ